MVGANVLRATNWTASSTDGAVHTTFHAWTAPSVNEAVELVARKTLALAATPKREVEQSITEDDFDTRVDEAPPPNQEPELRAEMLRKLFEAAKIEAMMVVESSRRDRDGLFVGHDAAVALLGAGDWNAEAVRAALGDAVAGTLHRLRVGADLAATKCRRRELL